MAASPLTVSGFYSMVDPELKKLFEEACDDMDLECSICYEPFKDPYLITVCQHVFCQVCINRWEAETCPLCRQKFTKEQVVKDSFKQKSINNVLERCKKELKAVPDKSEKSPFPLGAKKVVSISSSSSSSSSFSQPIETSNIQILQRSVEEESVPISMKHKFGQMIQFIFSEIAEDQSTQSSQRCTFKTEWSAHQKMNCQTTRDYWSSFQSGSCNSMSDYLDALENVAFSLADILKDQIKTLKLSGNSSRESVKHVYSGGGTIERSSGRSTITFQGGAGMDMSRIMTLLRDRHNSNFSAPEENCQIFVGGQEVRRSEANFIRALCRLDALLSECFSLRYARNEFANCFKALEKISPESVEKQNDALISLCDYCNGLLQEENLQKLLDHFNTLSLEKNGPPVLSKIAENLISVDSSNKEKIQLIVTSLDEQSIISIKNHIT
ncbi:MAG: RING finger domain-containing protein, partial [Chlamydiota bacterium]